MTNPFGYRDRRAVVTGGARGVGAALLDVLAELDVGHVTVIDLAQPSGPHHAFLPADLADESSVQEAIRGVEGPVHALFNNAGVADTMPPATVISVNYLALRSLSEGLLPKIPEGGAIVNTASIAGGQWPTRLDMINEVLDLGGNWESTLAWLDSHELGTQPYAFSKELVQVYTMRSSRPTQQRGVRTNSVCPAPIDTPLLKDFRETMTDKLIDWTVEQSNGRPVSPREVGLVLAFLGSDAAAYVNGVNMLVDAGFTAAMTTGQVDFAAIS